MCKRIIVFGLPFIFFFFLISCVKEYSYERTENEKLQSQEAKGFLGATLGQCTTILPNNNGELFTNVEVDPLDAVQITVNVTDPGKYNITTDVANGVWFNASGIFKKAGTYNINLQAHGIPINVGASTFTIRFDKSTCSFTLPVLTDLNTWSFWDGQKSYKGIINSGIVIRNYIDGFSFGGPSNISASRLFIGFNDNRPLT